MFDSFYGVVGFNGLLRKHLLARIRTMANNRIQFSSTTYSILYNLINNKKVGIYFAPKIRIKKFFSGNKALKVTGGYDVDSKKINVFVSWKFG